MSPTRLLWLGSLFLGLIAESQAKSGAAKAKGNLLDTVAIHRIYLDGDFDEAIDRIESALKYGGPFSHDDSIFIYKHLGVMYTAKYETREKGKQNMMRLLQVEPTARIMDMYASDMIYMIFKNIQDEYEMSQAKLTRAKNQLGQQTTEDNVPRKSSNRGKATKENQEGKPKSHAWVGWTVGAVAVAGGAAALIHFNEEASKPSRKENLLK